MRVGGYGFHESTPEGAKWSERRMNGLGLFAGTSLSRHLFAEIGLDFYEADADVDLAGEVDRMSSHVTGAVGVRLFPRSLISPFIQLGIGAEITQVETLERPKETHLLPQGFVGVGAELVLGDHIRLGGNVRMHMMGHPDGLVVPAGKDAFFDAAAAGQAQLFARYAM